MPHRLHIALPSQVSEVRPSAAALLAHAPRAEKNCEEEDSLARGWPFLRAMRALILLCTPWSTNVFTTSCRPLPSGVMMDPSKSRHAPSYAGAHRLAASSIEAPRAGAASESLSCVERTCERTVATTTTKTKKTRM